VLSPGTRPENVWLIWPCLQWGLRAERGHLKSKLERKGNILFVRRKRQLRAAALSNTHLQISGLFAGNAFRFGHLPAVDATHRPSEPAAALPSHERTNWLKEEETEIAQNTGRAIWERATGWLPSSMGSDAKEAGSGCAPTNFHVHKSRSWPKAVLAATWQSTPPPTARDKRSNCIERSVKSLPMVLSKKTEKTGDHGER
jgi:hypothetical protein